MTHSCGGCGDIYLTGPALELLALLGSLAFLPLGERDGKPLYIADGGEELSNAVLALSLNGLVTLDYASPIDGFDYSGYTGCTRFGSMALTKRGQDALESVDILGIDG